MDTGSLLERLRRFDTPTIANALEIARGQRTITGFTRQTLFAAFARLPPIVGFARTMTIRSSTPYDPAVRRKNQLDLRRAFCGVWPPPNSHPREIACAMG